MNLAEASAPKYLECPSGRVALISVTSTFHDCWAAGDQRPDLKGRPGVNPLRYETTHVVTEEMLDQLRKITEVVDINSENKLAVKEGFLTESGNDTLKFGQYEIATGSKPGTSTKAIKSDLERIEKSIKEALRQADYVLVSIHSHEMQGENKDKPAEFLTTIAKECIDIGAHAIIGHGPHILRGIEIYKNRPIFYSLGDFIPK
jgi:poly-gamma-glutamate capsule biosynthesis protein CapA/YwtB (metallophosphatase superfamily)